MTQHHVETVPSRTIDASVSIGEAMQGTLETGTDWLGVNQILARMHYLGPISRGRHYRDEFGVLVLATPSSRRLPHSRWLELVRWCLFGTKNGGSQQWKRVAAFLIKTQPHISTVVSYSDPSNGHTGALYRACNWLWAPTWHRLRPPPSGNGNWTTGKPQAVKDRWVFCLRPDSERENILRVKDESVLKLMPWASYVEGKGGDYKRWKAESNG